MSTIIDRQTDIDRDHEVTRARAALFRRAEAHGVKPVTSLEDLAGDPSITADFDVDEFLQQVRDDRDLPSRRSVE